MTEPIIARESPGPSIYLDGHATTPLSPEAEAAMAPWWREKAANAHSPHGRGQSAAEAVDVARRQIGELVGAGSTEIIFTSGATESNTLALIGTARSARSAGDHRRRVVVSAIEHKSVLEAAAALGREGFEIVHAPVASNGLIDLSVLADLVTPDTLIVSVMAANNEIGVIQPIPEIIAIARAVGALVHVDAAQAVGKIPVDLTDCDLASLSSHKMYGPVGVGALFVSSASPVRPEPLTAGGAQEGGLRPGTLPVPLIVGFGEAAAIARRRMTQDVDHASALAARLVSALRARQIEFAINAEDAPKLPGSLSLRITGCDAASLVLRLSNSVSLAEGSACTSGQILPSHVLTALGLNVVDAKSTIRIYCGRSNTSTEIDRAAVEIAAAIKEEFVAHWRIRPVGSAHERRAS